jgi:hypothetical protein
MWARAAVQAGRNFLDRHVADGPLNPFTQEEPLPESAMRRLLLSYAPSIARRLAVLTLGLGLAACGGGGGGGGGGSTPNPPVTPVDPGTPAAPTASFTAPATVPANQAAVFDASTSTAADGSTLTYVWDFGDGQRGGGKTIARSFGAGGARTVTLTVIDGGQRSGTATRTVTVAAPATGQAITVNGKVTATDGTPIQGVSVAWVGAANPVPGLTDAAGKVALAIVRGTAVTLKLSKVGYADQIVQLDLPAATGSDAHFEAIQRPRDAALTLADAAAGGSLTGRDGAGITVPASAFLDSAGKAVTGPIQIAVTPVDATQPGGGGFPGRFDGIQADGSTTPIVSFGAVEFIPTSASGGKLQLAPGKTATIDVPIYGARRPDGTSLAVGDSIPLWSLDETTSMWVQEGTGVAVASASSPSGLAMRASVSHLSWWNADLGFDPFGPRPRCEAAGDIGIPGAIDSFAAATVCNMLAEIDRTLSGGNSAKARPLAQTPASRVAGFSGRKTVPMTGGVTMPVPANLDVRLTATVLNGTWSGTQVVNGPVGEQRDVVVLLRPIGTTGTAPEAVITPFDAVRTLQQGQTARYSFTGTGQQFARVTVSSNDVSSTLQGRVRVLQGTTELGTATFGATTGTVVSVLPAGGTYLVEITGTANAPGGYHVKIDLPGTTQTETLPYGFAVTKDLPAFTRYRGSFTHSGTAAYFGLRNDRTVNGPVSLRILATDGTIVGSTEGSAAGALSQLVLPLPAGSYTADLSMSDGAAAKASIRGEPTPWVPVGELAPVNTSTYRGMIDLVADRNGRPVIGYWDTDMAAQTRTATLRLRRWTGTAWEVVGADQTVALGGGYCSTPAYVSIPRTRMASFAFDSANNPWIAYRIDQDAGNANSVGTTTVRAWSNGSWQAVGPNDGKLPFTANNYMYCEDPPQIALTAANRPVVAYRTSNGVTVQRHDGTAWKGLASAAADHFTDAGSDYGGGFALAMDAAQQVWLAQTGRTALSVQRFNTASGSTWESVGTLPTAGGGYYSGARLAFTSTGPVLGVFATSSATSTLVYRYNGTAWTTAGFYPLGVNENVFPFHDAVSLAPSGSDVMVSWAAGMNANWYSPIVQRSTATSWSPVGPGIGEIPQFTWTGINQQNLVTSPLLLQAPDGLYLATLLAQRPPAGGDGGYRLILSKKVAN